MDDANADKARLKELEAWCVEARALLALAKPGEDGVKPAAETLATRPLFATGAGLHGKAREIASGGAPAEARGSQRSRFDAAAEPFKVKPAQPGAKPKKELTQTEKEAAFKDPQLEHWAGLAEAFSAVERQILAEIKQRQVRQAELQRLPPGVPGATADEILQVDGLRNAAAKAVDEADSDAALSSAGQAIEAFAKRRDEFANQVADRLQRLQPLREQAAAVGLAPPELPKALDTLRSALTALLETAPASEASVTQATQTLADLQKAAQDAEAEALDLRQLRRLYQAQAQALRDQLARLDLASVISLPNNLKGYGAEIGKKIADAEAVLVPVRSRGETATFPALIEAARLLFRDLVRSSLIGSSPGAKENARKEANHMLTALEAQAAQLPSKENAQGSYREDITAEAGKIRNALNTGSAQQRSQAATRLTDLADDIDEHRKQSGLDQQLYHQRWDQAATTAPARAAIAGCLPAYVQALAALRLRLDAQAPVRLSLPEVQVIETAAQQYGPTWQAASDDAQLQRQVDEVWQRIQALDPDTLLAAARGPVQAEAGKARTAADAAAKVSSVGRDMNKALALAQALEQRLLAVRAEPPFDANAAALQLIPAPQRQAAHDLCGGALLAQLGDPARTALGQALAAHGPAIATLASQAFGGNPKVLEQALRDCGAEGLAMLAQAFDGDDKATSREALQGLIDKAGLGDKPAILARLIGPVPPDPARSAAVKSLADNFKDEAGQQALGTLLGGCGLDSQPDLLASVLATPGGLGGDGAKLRAFANDFVGDAAAPARAGMKRLVTTAGLGTHPKALAPLVRRGGSAAIKKVGAAFVDPADCGRLKGLLERGGLGGRAGDAGHANEHPDTLAQLLQDGLGGSGEHLKTYAKAFAGVDGEAKSKEMLGALNEYGNAHAASRQPGKAVGQLLSGGNLQGTMAERIGLMSSQFVPELQQIPDATKRKQAMRMAPYLSTKAGSRLQPTATMQAENYKEATASVSKRHLPESYSLQYAKDKNYFTQTLFPPGVDLAQLVDQAVLEHKAGRVFGKDADALEKDRVTVLLPPTNTPMTVEFAFVMDGGQRKIVHFGPRNDPPPGGLALTNGPPHPLETPKFSRAQVEAMYKALGKPT